MMRAELAQNFRQLELKKKLEPMLPVLDFIAWSLLKHNQDVVSQLWVLSKQRSWRTSKSIPNSLWNWICSAVDEVTLDPMTKHAWLLLSDDYIEAVDSRDIKGIKKRPNIPLGWRHDDFKFTEEADLLLALRPIQARKVLAAWKLSCQTAETSSSSVGASPGPPAFLQSLSPRNSSSTSSSSCQSPDIDWMDTFMTPWDKFPEELMQSLERGKSPSPRLRKEIVRCNVECTGIHDYKTRAGINEGKQEYQAITRL
ncbi:hypothetical protein P4O66_007997 [Electrophorus voltai]|uniref:Uncharacterized protein n=2 Tax=Electrophorus voltai TaxID=2609070 RepID=A0AAD8ZGD6_9TELE|nr:hypothetical protein P4O66_007997 [Electrophorus voltai]